MEAKNINWFGLLGGTMTLILILDSILLATPWWQLQAGQEFVQADISPLNTNLSLFGTTISIPILWILNITCLLSLTASAITILIYSILPTKSYSRHLLNFAYKKPLITLILFIIILIIATYGADAFFHFGIPITGSTTTTLPRSLTGETEITAPITTRFTWTFALAIAAAITCIAARIYHYRITSTE